MGWPLVLATLAFTLVVHSMRLDPERVAARLRIEQEIEEDRLREALRRDPSLSRSRRQLATPKEIQIQVTAPLFSSRLFDYGREAGDQEIPRSLDVGKKLDLHNPIRFYGENFKAVYVLSNGGIGFDSGSRSYKTHILPGSTRLIAPFWNRNDLRNGGGHVWYREILNGRVLERGQSEIRYQYDKNVKVRSAIVVTWEKMQPLGGTILPDENTNTFQAALFITDNGTFANFIYSNVGWTQGAEAGFNKGDGSGAHFALPTSGSENIMYLEEYGNTGIPGEWMFELGVDRVIRCKAGFKGDTCDQECSSGEWGADCNGCCHCANGVCDPTFGSCKAGCSECWTGASCSIKKDNCKARNQPVCAANALSYLDRDRCGEPVPKCQCLAGFIGDGYRKCEDVNECKAAGVCHAKATCTNTPGRFFCQCIDGFTGDGVVSCVPALLYSIQPDHVLPRGRNVKMPYPLEPPILLFGELRDSLTISSNGIIAVGDLPKTPAQFFHLDDIGVYGIAPFYAPIDLSKGGSITVSEAKESSVLSRISESISRAAGEPFQIDSALMISYNNVTDGKSKKGNTFQCVLTTGRLANRPVTFAQLLYKDLLWSHQAEAGIVSPDSSNWVSLPGSGTEGIELLTQLSNVKQPGIWLFRVDEELVPGCLQVDQQPPYCEAESTDHQPTLAAHPPGQKISTTHKATTSTTTTTTQAPRERRPLPGPRFIQPEIVKPPPTASRPSTRDQELTRSPETEPPATTTPRPRPAFHSTPHKPLVSISDADINDIPPDVFEVTFPPFVTVIPEIFTQRTRVQRPDFSGLVTDETASPSKKNKVPTVPPGSEVTEIPNQEENSIEPFPPKDDQALFQLPPPHPGKEIKRVQEVISPSTTTPRAPFAHPGGLDDLEEARTRSKVSSPSLRNRILDVSLGRRTESVPNLVTGEPEDEETVATSQEPPVTTSAIDLSLLFANRPAASTSTTTPVETSPPQTNHFLVLTTRAPPRHSSPRVLSGEVKTTTTRVEGKAREAIVTAPPTVPNDPFKQHEAANAAASRMAVIIPASIVAAWLLILLCIVLFFFCKRRRSSERLHGLYGPSYSVRPVGGYNVKRNSQQLDTSTSYEDHLDKAARISAEMNAYNQNGRVSLYGSYWNLNNATSPSGSHESRRRSPHMASYQQTGRFAYTGRY